MTDTRTVTREGLAEALCEVAFDLDLPPDQITRHPDWYDEPGPDEHLVFDLEQWGKDVADAIFAALPVETEATCHDNDHKALSALRDLQDRRGDAIKALAVRMHGRLTGCKRTGEADSCGTCWTLAAEIAQNDPYDLVMSRIEAKAVATGRLDVERLTQSLDLSMGPERRKRLAAQIAEKYRRLTSKQGQPDPEPPEESRAIHEHGPSCGYRKEYAPNYRQASEADDFRWVPDCDCPGRDYASGFHNKTCPHREAEPFA